MFFFQYPLERFKLSDTEAKLSALELGQKL